MANRVAFFASNEEVESFFSLNTLEETVFEPNYNISPGNQLPVIRMIDGGKPDVGYLKWGKSNDSHSYDTVVFKDELDSFIKNKKYGRCIVPLSGFYIWKDDDESKHPFFVRMLNSPIMPVPAILDNDKETVSLITAPSNTLIQPMTEKMPLLLDRELALAWLANEGNIGAILASAENLFGITDLSVLKVSKKVNDPKLNNPKLIQPIPK